MILRLARKDFLTNLLSARFVVGFILCLVLIPFSILINIGVYRSRTVQFRIDHDAAEKAMRGVRVYSKLRPEIIVPPEPLSVFSKGITDQVGNRIQILLGDKPMLAAGKTEAGDNPFLASFFSVDFADITAIVFSLLALLFSYDALTREREDGTLKFQLANSLGRSTCLAGKVLGILFTLLPILAFSFLLSIALVFLSRELVFSPAQWGRIVLLFGASLVYLMVFVFIGLFVSARSKTSVTSLVLCLFLWVLFVFLIPNLSSNAAESFFRVPSRENLDRVLADLDRELDEKTGHAFKAQGVDQSGWYWNYSGVGLDGEVETYGNAREVFEKTRRSAEIGMPLRLEYAEKRWASEKAYLDGLARQARLSEKLSLVSPTGIFRTMAAAVCGTNLSSYEALMDRARQYREAFLRFLEAKNIFSSFRWITPAPPESFFPTDDAAIEARTGGEFKTAAAFWSWAKQQKDQFAAVQRVSKVKIHGDSRNDFPPLDISDMPRFPEEPMGLFSGLQDSVLDAGLLLVEIVLLFYVGYVAFLRFDVR
jgi:ABC-type transport system involved in multi-copper enzyme maturation permease subunit